MNIVITGSRKGIGRYLSDYFLSQGHVVFGCSRSVSDISKPNYHHTCLDVADEDAIHQFFFKIRKSHKAIDVLINNAGIASMNHAILTPHSTIKKILDTNVTGTFLFCREGIKLLKNSDNGRIINFTSVASPLHLEGEAIYAASKEAVNNLTKTLAHEFSAFGVTVNAIGPTPIETDLIKAVPKNKIQALLNRQGIKKMGTLEDVLNVVKFFIDPKSSFITAQTLYLGGVC